MKYDREILAKGLYETYCAAVGGKAFNGDPLPCWDDFRYDPAKAKQVDAWFAAAEFAIASNQAFAIASTKANATGYTASVKVMRSHDYCHFEVCLGSNEPEDLEGIDLMRKQAARLADKAVEQYKVAKRNAAWRESAERDCEYERARVEDILAVPESERSPEQKAALKAYEDASFRRNRYNYDYQDDWEDWED